MASISSLPKEKPAGGPPPGRGRLAVRSRNLSILVFAVTFCIMAVVMAAVFGGVTEKISAEYAESYAAGAAETFGSRIAKELGILSKVAASDAVSAWLADENNEQKKALAHSVMSEIVGDLYSFNLYAVADNSLSEYKLGTGDRAGDFQPFVVLDPANPTDDWYFACKQSDNEYIISVNIDHEMQRKRVWIDYKVMRDGVCLGAVCTGLEFSHIVGEIFSHSANMRGLIVDKNGMIHVDSSLMNDTDFLHTEFETPITGAFSDPDLLAALTSFLAAADEYSQDLGEVESIRLNSDSHLYLACVPIQYSDWVVAIVADDTSLFGWSLFLPVVAAVVILLTAFALAVSAINSRLIFRPLGQLDHSLALMKENSNEKIYGTERDDELGQLAQTIQDLFNQANVDALTGIYNRRYMAASLERVLSLLSRSGGVLSVIMADIDYFKKYNDTYGHDQGDVCLRAVAQSLAGTVKRTDDFAARYGGEEFIAILPNTGEDGARLIADSLLENIRALGITHAANEAAPCVTVSVGVATGQVMFGQDWEAYVKRADEALYMSKQGGRNRYTYLDLPQAET